MLKWIHHLLEPHCAECRLEAEEKKICQSCEALKLQLDAVNYEKRQLLQSVLELAKPAQIEERQPHVDYEAIKPKSVPWLVKRQMLEEEDRAKAKVISENKKRQQEAKDNSIEKLETELGVK